MKSKIIKAEILSIFLHILGFICLYFTGQHVPIVLQVMLMYSIPGAINSLLFRKIVKGWKRNKQEPFFAAVAVPTLICYAVFAYIFEKYAGVDGVLHNSSYLFGELELELKGRFFCIPQFIFVFAYNWTMQLFINGTRTEYTVEEIEAYLWGDRETRKKIRKKK